MSVATPHLQQSVPTHMPPLLRVQKKVPARSSDVSCANETPCQRRRHCCLTVPNVQRTQSDQSRQCRHVAQLSAPRDEKVCSPTCCPRPSQSHTTSFSESASRITDLDPSTAPMSPARAPPTIRSDSARGKQAMHSAAAAAPGTLSQATSSSIRTCFARRRQSLDTDPIPCITSAQSDLASVAAAAGLTSRTRDTIIRSTCSGRSIGSCVTVAKQRLGSILWRLINCGKPSQIAEPWRKRPFCTRKMLSWFSKKNILQKIIFANNKSIGKTPRWPTRSHFTSSSQ